MSLSVFLNMPASLPARYAGSHSCRHVVLPRQHLVQPEVHRPHVERRDLRLELQRRLQPLLDGHRLRAAGRDVDDDVRRGGDRGRNCGRAPDPASAGRRAGSRACRWTIAAPAVGGADGAVGDLRPA